MAAPTIACWRCRDPKCRDRRIATEDAWWALHVRARRLADNDHSVAAERLRVQCKATRAAFDWAMSACDDRFHKVGAPLHYQVAPALVRALRKARTPRELRAAAAALVEHALLAGGEP